MSAHAIIEEYFSGQGVVLVGVRDAITGKPLGLRPVGNCPALTLANATEVLEHKESTTGARGTDKRLTTAINVTMSATFENFDSSGLADAIRGLSTEVAAGTVADEAVLGYPGLVTALANIKVASVVVSQGATALTPYVDAATPWDVQINTETGSFQLNDAKVLPLDNAGSEITAVTVGATTQFTATNTLAIGQKVVVSGLTGADAALVNGKKATVTAASGTAFSVNIVTTGKTITATGDPVYLEDGVALTVDYTYAAHQLVGAFTEGAKELYLRFEGLNTVEENSPVVVEVFKFLLDPTQELALISDTIQSFVLEGSVLADNAQVTGSKYYRVKKIDKA